MNYIPFEITVLSADVFKKSYFFTKPQAYAVVSLTGDPGSRQRTPVDKHGGAKPLWDFSMKFEVDERKLHQNSAVLMFQLRRHRTIGDKDIGSLYVPVKELFEVAGVLNCRRTVAFPVYSSSGNPKGVIYLSYLFGETADSPELFGETMGFERDGVTTKGGERVINYPLPSAPPCPVPSAPYLPVGGCFSANPTPSAPYMQDDF